MDDGRQYFTARAKRRLWCSSETHGGLLVVSGLGEATVTLRTCVPWAVGSRVLLEVPGPIAAAVSAEVEWASPSLGSASGTMRLRLLASSEQLVAWERALAAGDTWSEEESGLRVRAAPLEEDLERLTAAR